MFSKKLIHCVLTGDAEAALPMAVVMASAARSLSSGHRIKFNIVDCGLLPRQIDRLAECAKKVGTECDFLKVTDYQLSVFPICRHFPPAANARLLLSSLISKAERVIYLDSDMVVDRDLAELWNNDLQGFGIAAVPNSRDERPMDDDSAMLYAADDLPNRSDVYFNSGLLIADLAIWRRMRVEESVRKFFSKFGGKTICPDQDALNFTFSGQYKRLEAAWNVHCPSTDEDHLSRVRRLLRRRTTGGAVYHLVGAYKPWNGGPRHPCLASYARELAAARWLRLWEWPYYWIRALRPPHGNLKRSRIGYNANVSFDR